MHTPHLDVPRKRGGPRYGLLLVALATMAALPPSASGQAANDAADAGRFLAGQTAGQSPVLSLPEDHRHLADTGGWVSTTLLTLADVDHNRNLRDTIDDIAVVDARLWASWITSPRQDYYLRVRKLTLVIDKPPSTALQDTRDIESVDLDLGWVDFPMGAVDARLGRQLIRAGRGLALSQVLDGIHFSYPRGGSLWESFVARTTDRAPTIDNSIVGFDRGVEDRVFWGFQYTRHNVGGNSIHAFLVDNNDNTHSQSPAQDAFDFSYNSDYAGIGSEGPVADWGRWYAEYIHAWGNTFNSSPAPARMSISADAFDAALYWFVESLRSTAISMEYSLGSGDPNRSNVTTQFGGRTAAASTDRVFRSFGRFETGLGLSPLLSNLQILRLGVEWKPYVDRLSKPSDLTLGVHFRQYWKDSAAGGISDSGASLASANVGFGTDAIASWRATSDLTVLFNYGLFLPGSAYPVTTHDPTERFLITTTLSF